jgi:hypothetical protein
MAACPALKFDNFKQARFDCLVEKAHSAGITISGHAGEATRSGVTVRWHFDPAAGTLQLHCIDLPFFLSCDLINGQLQSMIARCPE